MAHGELVENTHPSDETHLEVPVGMSLSCPLAVTPLIAHPKLPPGPSLSHYTLPASWDHLPHLVLKLMSLSQGQFLENPN